MRSEVGSVTAEAAVVLPVLALVTLLLAALIGLVATATSADEAARAAARELARGGSTTALQADLRDRWPDVQLLTRQESGLVIVQVRRPVAWPGLLGRLAPVREVVGEAAVALEWR